MTGREGEKSGPARLHAVVEGRVQGVGFRYFVIETAQRLGLMGWVRNRWDDTVEVTAEGDRSALDQLVAELHHGPRAALVTRVEVTWQTANGEFTRFSVLSTH
jgi:acylphosphatase